MKMVEIKLRSTTAELEKLLARKERAEAKLTKTEQKCERLGCKWTVAEHGAWMDTVETANGWMTNKKEIELNGAWLDWFICPSNFVKIVEGNYTERGTQNARPVMVKHGSAEDLQNFYDSAVAWAEGE